eukprot:9496546-Pyramimonas_sp.AAC.1
MRAAEYSAQLVESRCEPQNIPLSWSNHDASHGTFRSVGRITMRATEYSAQLVESRCEPQKFGGFDTLELLVYGHDHY